MSAYDEEYYDEEEEYEQEMTPEEKERAARNSLRLINLIIFLIGAMVCGWAYYSGVRSFNGAWVAYVVAGIGFASVFISCLGCCGVAARHNQMLLLYYCLLVLASFALFVAGGMCFILTNQAVVFVRKNWAQLSLQQDGDGDVVAAEEEVATNLRFSGAFAFFLSALLCCAMSSTVALVKRLQAYTILLQSTNIALMPFGVLLIASAAFIGDTAASVDAPATAFAVFVLGVFVICVSFVGCFGTSISSRGLLKVSMYILTFLAIGFFGFGAGAFAAGSTLREKLSTNWTTIRRVLPPTFSGKYDQERFEAFLEGNLNAMGYASLCMSAFLTVMIWGCVKLRAALKEANDEALTATDVPPMTGFVQGGAAATAREKWKQTWTHGTTSSRRLIKCACVCLCCLVLMAVVLSSLALYFSTSCFTLSTFNDSNEFHAPTDGEVPPVKQLAVWSNYSRGLTQVVIDEDAEAPWFKFEKSALQAGFENQEDSEALISVLDDSRSRMQLQVDPGAKTEVLTYDISCQMAVVNINIPPATLGGETMEESRDGYSLEMLTISQFAGIELSPGEEAPRFRNVVARSTVGAITFDGAKLGAEGGFARSSNGEVVVVNTDAHCDPVNLGTGQGQVYLRTSLGSVLVSDSTFTDCELVGVGEASLVQAEDVTLANSLGTGALMSLSGIKGLVEAKTSTSDVFNLRSTEGTVRATEVVARENLKCASQSGAVIISDSAIELGGSVQVETTSGDISIHLTKFSGFVSVHTSGFLTVEGCTEEEGCVEAPWYGDVDIVEPTDEEREAEDSQVVASFSATVNCDTECAYRGEMIVTSSTGSISITVDEWTAEEQTAESEE